MWLLVGLGNPGREYAETRHNVGFLVLDELARRHDADVARAKFGAELRPAELTIAGARHKALLLKPMELMNVSGRAVQRAATFYQIPPESWIVVHDDIDLDLGRIQVKAGGGHAGHNGIRSIMSDSGTRDFLRVRVGVGRPGAGREAAGHVLGGFSKGETKELPLLLAEAADAVESILASGATTAMNRFNNRKLERD